MINPRYTTRGATAANFEPDLVLAIDPGTRTGLARLQRMYSRSSADPQFTWVELETLPLHRALAYVQDAILEAQQTTPPQPRAGNCRGCPQGAGPRLGLC